MFIRKIAQISACAATASISLWTSAAFSQTQTPSEQG